MWWNAEKPILANNQSTACFSLALLCCVHAWGRWGREAGGGGWAYSIRLFSHGMSSCSPSFFPSLPLPYYCILHYPSLSLPAAPPSITFSISSRCLPSFLSSRPCPTPSSLPHISLSPLLLLLRISGTQCREWRRSMYGDLCLLW